MRRLILPLGCQLLLLLGVFGCGHQSKYKPYNSQQMFYFKTSFQDESQFIIETIVTDLTEQMFYAKYHRAPQPNEISILCTEVVLPDRNPFAFHLEITAANHHKVDWLLRWEAPIWAPELYAPVAEALSKNLGVRGSRSVATTNSSLLMALTDLKAQTIERENLQISKALAADFADPWLHEQAAALLGAFALRDHCGDFFEARLPMCRMTAHLAMAAQLRGAQSPGINGRVAEAMLLTLMNCQTPALAKLKTLDQQDPAVIRWKRSLEAFNTGDYRPMQNELDPSPLERAAWFSALSRSVNSTVAWPLLTRAEKNTPDFVRIANTAGYSVETGHELLGVAVQLELREMEAVCRDDYGQLITATNLVRTLNRTPERCFQPSGTVLVIGRGQWSYFFQRSLCHAIQSNFDFMQRKWGVPDEARRFADVCRGAFGGLRLYPFVRALNNANPEAIRPVLTEITNVVCAAPHLVPNLCLEKAGMLRDAASEPVQYAEVEWFRYSIPFRTAYDPAAHFGSPVSSFLVSQDEYCATLHTLAPYDRQILNEIWRFQYQSHPTFEQASALYREVTPYATYAVVRLAQTVTNDPQRYEQLLLQTVELEPDRYFTLGDYFKGKHLDDKAAFYYERGNRLGKDAVGASNRAFWLVSYYLKKGENEKARQVADQAAEVYSSIGLEAKAYYLEKTGDYGGAFEYYCRIEERYGDAAALEAFCKRYREQTGDTRFESKLLQRVFPNGTEKAVLADLHGPPADGVLLDGQSDLLSAAGLKRGDVIVALSGTLVHNRNQYSLIRSSLTKPEMHLIVWHAGTYLQITSSPPHHLFGVNIADYQAPRE